MTMDDSHRARAEDKARPAVRCNSTGYSSQRYGACECCGKDASDVWIGTPDNGFTHFFGHEACVRKAIGLKESA